MCLCCEAAIGETLHTHFNGTDPRGTESRETGTHLWMTTMEEWQNICMQITITYA